MKHSPIEHLTKRFAASAASLLLAITVGCGSEVDVTDMEASDSWDTAELEDKSGDPCTNPSTAPVDQARWASNDTKLGNAKFVFYDYDKSSRRHVVPIENSPYSHIYIVEVGSQSRDPSYVKINRRTTSANVKFIAGGGSSDKYQNLHEVDSNNAGKSATFNQPMGGGKCIRDEGQYVVIYTNKAMRQTRATMRDPMLTGHDNQYKGAPNDLSFSLIADDETNHPNRTREGGATQRMIRSANFYTFEDEDNGFFVYKHGASVPTFTGNGCDAQYEFSGASGGEPAPSASYQAESRTAQSGCTTETSRTGYTGSGYGDFGGKDTWIEWNNIRVPAAGRYELRFRYANAAPESRPVAIRVNGAVVGTVAFPGTGSWTAWGTASMRVTLNSGNNSLRVVATTDAGGPNLDRVDLVK